MVSTKALKPAPFILKPKVAIIKASETIVSLPKSILSRTLDKSIASDLAFFHGRRFKIGWSHSNCLTVATTAMTSKSQTKQMSISNCHLFSGRIEHDASKTVIKQIKISSLEPHDSQAFINSIENHLQCQLNYSKIESQNQNDCPCFVPKDGTDILEQHHRLAAQNFDDTPLDGYLKTCYNVWSLCVALWGFQEELEDVSDADHIAIMLRRDLLSKWLENTVTDKNLLKSCESEVGYLPHLVTLLAAHKVNEACDLAFNNGDMNLSLLLSQSGGSSIVRSLVLKQLESWRLTEADKFVDVNRLKAMMLVSGISSFTSSNNSSITIYEDLDWVKSLAVSNFFSFSKYHLLIKLVLVLKILFFLTFRQMFGIYVHQLHL